jgi:hypothetical protein
MLQHFGTRALLARAIIAFGLRLVALAGQLADPLFALAKFPAPVAVGWWWPSQPLCLPRARAQ